MVSERAKNTVEMRKVREGKMIKVCLVDMKESQAEDNERYHLHLPVARDRVKKRTQLCKKGKMVD